MGCDTTLKHPASRALALLKNRGAIDADRVITNLRRFEFLSAHLQRIAKQHGIDVPLFSVVDGRVLPNDDAFNARYEATRDDVELVSLTSYPVQGRQYQAEENRKYIEDGPWDDTWLSEEDQVFVEQMALDGHLKLECR